MSRSGVVSINWRTVDNATDSGGGDGSIKRRRFANGDDGDESFDHRRRVVGTMDVDRLVYSK